jgi:hypothetical protein
MYQSPISECYPLSFTHSQRQDEVSKRFKQNDSTAEHGSERYNWESADPPCISYNVAECTAIAASKYECHYYKPFNLRILIGYNGTVIF